VVVIAAPALAGYIPALCAIPVDPPTSLRTQQYFERQAHGSESREASSTRMEALPSLDHQCEWGYTGQRM
jgi:hypothetical protein